MKFLFPFFVLVAFISCNSGSKQYELSAADVQKLEELACYLAEKYQDEKAHLSFTRDLQTRVTVAYDRLLLKEMVATSQQTLVDLEHNFNTLQILGVKCNGKAVALSEDQIASRTRFLEAVSINIAHHRSWNEGNKVRSAEAINAQTQQTVTLSKNMK